MQVLVTVITFLLSIMNVFDDKIKKCQVFEEILAALGTVWIKPTVAIFLNYVSRLRGFLVTLTTFIQSLML